MWPYLAVLGKALRLCFFGRPQYLLVQLYAHENGYPRDASRSPQAALRRVAASNLRLYAHENGVVTDAYARVAGVGATAAALVKTEVDVIQE